MNSEALKTLFSISLKTRILREWQKSSRADEQDFSERELMTLELISDFAPITEKALAKIYGASFSSINDLVKKLTARELIDPDKSRGKPLELTTKGKAQLEKLKATSAQRLTYLFEGISDEEWKDLVKVFQRVDKNAERYVQQFVFDRYQ